ncbi:extracellular solute-binding protein [Leucobacter sp. OH2974_COT-288]|nr:extracellular solute-binding protein [Leucobacter sp. OH2974_COT-288]
MLLLGALAGCSAAAENSAAPAETAAVDAQLQGTITLYTSEPQAKIDEIVVAFEAQYPGAKVEVFRAATGELKTRIAAEQETGKIEADVILAADVPTFEKYAAAGELVTLELTNSAALDAYLIDDEDFWVATRIIPTVIAVNTTASETSPSTWQDLTKTEYSGKIAMPNPDVSGAAAFNTAVWYSDAQFGAAWLQQLVANNPTILESNGPVGQAVASGTSSVGIVVDYVVRELAAKGAPVRTIYPADGVPYVSQPAGVFKDSDNQQLANAFVDFLISPEAQKLAVQQAYLPVRKDVGVPEGAPELENLQLLEIDLGKIAAQQDQAVDFFNSLLQQ